jgi:hypothetical protein
MDELELLELNPEAFEAFLKRRAPTDVAGEARCIGTCPLADWLQEKFETPRVIVDTGGIVIVLNQREKTYYRMPAWMQRYMLEIDQDRRIGDPVFVDEALIVLACVRKGFGL